MMNLLERIESLPWVLGSLIIVIFFVVFTIIGIILVRKTFNAKNQKTHNDVGGFVFTNLGVLYSVLLGFTVVNVQQRFDKIKETAQIEASYLGELYGDSAVFSEKDRHEIRQAIKAYIASVINDEWPAMAKRETNMKTLEALKNIWNIYYGVELSTKKQEIWYSESISKLNLMVSSRLSRVLGREESLGSEMWSLLILGGIIIVIFVGFFGLENLTTHLFMASVLAATTAFLLFLIYSLDTAFSGGVSIPPEPFIKILEALNA